MEDGAPPQKRAKFDLTSTFDVVVGEDGLSKRFTVYTNVVTERSEFFCAPRDPKSLKDPTVPTDLADEDPEIFSMYLNCVYFGIEAIMFDVGFMEDHHAADEDETPPDAFRMSEGKCTADGKKFCVAQSDSEKRFEQEIGAMAKTYLLADRLGDLQTANMVIDKIICHCDEAGMNVTASTASLVYESTIHGNPLRKLLRDEILFETRSKEYLCLHVPSYPSELMRDVAVQFLRMKNSCRDDTMEDIYHASIRHGMCEVDKCCYHQHNEKHPRCVPEPVFPREAADRP